MRSLGASLVLVALAAPVVAQVKTSISDEATAYHDPDAPITCPTGSTRRTSAETFRDLDPVRHAEARSSPPPGHVAPVLLAPPPLKYPGNIFTRKPGFASVFVVIRVDGRTAEPQVVCSSGEKFERAAVESITQAEFRPATQDGESIESTGIVPFEFKTI